MSEDNTRAIVAIPGKGSAFPETMPLLVLPDQVPFPMSVLPLHLDEKADARAIEDVSHGNRFVALSAAVKDLDGPSTIANARKVGCIGRLLQLQHLPDDSLQCAIQIVKRMRIIDAVQEQPYPVVRIEALEDIKPAENELAPLAAAVKAQMARLIELSPNLPDQAQGFLDNITNPGFLADLVAANINVSLEEKQQLLETLNRKKRLERLTKILGQQLDILEISAKIQRDARGTIDSSQREYFLRQQLKAIQDELGEGADGKPELDDYREKIAALPEEARKEATRELKRLSQMNEASAEYHIILTYLDWLTDLPWNESTEDHLDMPRADKVLNEDHHGLEKVKRRIIEYLAVRKLKPDAPGPILCFVGPPGVGKTSLGQSIARAMGRRFVRMALGGIRDEAEIRGHRRTYVGAMPGRIIQSIRKAETNNPVFMLDEIDKLGADFRGDPSSALLEVLDPAQNDTFQDLYLNVPFDLSKVIFIATANVLDTVPWALRDRMEIIQISGYTTHEKLEIAKKYLVPRQLERHGITLKQLRITASALRAIIASYTREAGVRNLEREIANVCRGVARHIAEGRGKATRIEPGDLKKYLGNPRFEYEVAERTSVAGVATGLAWTATGGDMLFVEATRMPGKGNLVLTGQLGDVMKESATAVLSYVRSNAEALGMAPEIFQHSDIHIHVPQGAVPKDGPSAGVTILAAVASLLLGKKIKSGLAMTGEITLRGQVLPVGGVKEKVLAASRAGIKHVILPARNELDLEDVPDTVRNKMRFYPVQRMDEVLDIALGISSKGAGAGGNGRTEKKRK